MGGFMGIGHSAQQAELEAQNTLKKQEAERARRAAEIALAERKANKGQEIAKLQLGGGATPSDTPVKKKKSPLLTRKRPSNPISSNLGLGAGKTGVQT